MSARSGGSGRPKSPTVDEPAPVGVPRGSTFRRGIGPVRTRERHFPADERFSKNEVPTPVQSAVIDRKDSRPELPRAGLPARITAVILTVLNTALGFLLVYHKGPERWGEMIGGTLAPVVLVIAMTYVVMIIPRFRSPRSFVHVYAWSSLFVLMSSVNQIAERVGRVLDGVVA